MHDRNTGNALHYISKAIERPLMILPEKLAIIASVLEGRIGLDTSGLAQLVDEKMLAYVSKPSPAANRFEGDVVTQDGQPARSRPFKPYKVSGSTAIIPVIGSLVNRGAWLGSYSGMTSYEGLRHQLAAAAKDSAVSSVLLDIDSPGGEAVGAFETGEDVRKLNAIKPVAAFVNGLCCSAAYAIASQAGRVEASTTSLLGSIGVVMMHADHSKRLHDMGVKPTFIFAGAHKVDGNPFQPLSKDVEASLQAEVDKLYDLFVAHVATGRKSLSAKAVREQEARTFIGSDAVERKLADAIGTFEATLSGLQRRSKTTRTMKMDNENVITMAQHETLVAAAVNTATTQTTQQVTQALTAEHTNALNAAVANARTEGATAERERISAILALPEAQGRQASALHMAMTTIMTADAVKPVLAGLPIGAGTQTVVPSNGLGLVMDKAPQPEAAAASWDKALVRAGAKLPGQKTA
jgi:signal peptide peptidase SppA